MLAVEVVFLTGRYVATSFNDRTRAEWPPHPARLFSALVATHFESREPSDDERASLAWLERQGSPTIAASAADARDVVTVFVPVNDTTVIGSLDAEASRLANAQAAVETEGTNGSKALASARTKLAKAEARFTQAVRLAVAPVAAGKEGKEGPRLAESLLPDRRTRQARTFPSVFPSDSRVTFAWPHAEAPDEVRTSLDALAARLVRLGHSSSLVTARVREESPPATWMPEDVPTTTRPSGECVLRVVNGGQFDALCSDFDRQGDTPGRVLPFAFQRYVRCGEAAAQGRGGGGASDFGDDWIVLRRIDAPDTRSLRLPSRRAVDVARSARRALLAGFGPEAPEVLSGHGRPDEPSSRPHLAIIPLPFVGWDRADGSIGGVALALPRARTTEDLAVLYRALGGWHKVSGGKGEDLRLAVHLGSAGSLLLEPADETGSVPTTLSPETWCRPALRWASATPVALDRNPGDLRANDPYKEAAAYAHAEASIALACEHVGLPRPARVVVTPAAPLAGGEKARLFPPFKSGGVQRVLVHATLVFDAPVRGPVLLGAGRYFGLGLFRPLRDHG
jgi:CRISPR-associated protein Csb2